MRSQDIIIGGFGILIDAYFAIVNSAFVRTDGSVTFDGDFYIINFDKSSVELDMGGDLFLNFANFTLDSLLAESEPRVLIYYTNVFNNGDMFFGDSGNHSRALSIRASEILSNKGMMVFKRASGDKLQLNLGSTTHRHSILKNSGSICLYNTSWKIPKNIEKHGCITVGTGSILDFLLRYYDYISPFDQIIYLESDSEVRISGLKSPLATIPSIEVVGWSEDNKIILDTVIESTEKLVYSEDTGILSIFGTAEPIITLNIGKGYWGAAFRLLLDDYGSTLQYWMSVLGASRPSKCRCVTEFPKVPTTRPSS
ncbi:hypothetical protein METBIDRAFT_31021 [Metschnikowia bicuspidata var. bicuspidata NRRL YB-4993]|uniref:Hyphally-regulated cell wall protein N-terminal domain-containing protein n=1 Tax=Metschnikowia bicuspidata var. bicuspidata NRRL YB-4993 TaxID=869754 RepID=A0A1A0HDQ2_9ASCO|nr:hypothetical protein METBIDRAFT_31021 [Metschnikowia bicuspidata var. bicuspidata NRRL YB-4993]OBA22053.1 hypothetical protein METBIDRAFT_31021 [Metschnikowia bicuspidata var. bicuspidata NRRL YB-4993]